jgi:nitroreductase
MPDDLAPPVTIVYTSTFWRNAWKYESRAYRHAFWDSGTILANSLAIASANGLPARVVTRYLDAPINDLVDVDGVTEASVALLALGTGNRAPAVDAPGPISLPVLPLSREPVDYPQIRQAHAATMLSDDSSLSDEALNVLWTTPAVHEDADPDRERVALSRAASMSATIEEVILKRGSSRRFARQAIPFSKLAAILDAAGEPTQLDGANGGSPLNDIYLLANDVDGLEQGVYLHRRGLRNLEPVAHKDTRALAQHLALDQPLGGDAAAALFFVAHLPAVVGRLGARGYRTAHLDASIRAGRVYLASYALDLGASGLTFYDDEVVEALGAASNSAVTFLIAVGLPFKAGSRQS